MTAHRASRARLVSTAVLAALSTAWAPVHAVAEQANPGDIIVKRQITPRDAFDSVPKTDNPIASKVETFPTRAFSPTVAGLMSDLELELEHTHGSAGLAATSRIDTAAGKATLATLGLGASAGARSATGAGVAGQRAGIGGAVTSSVTGVLAPVGAAVGALK
ncbi:hypothetical protein B0G57_101727 [Trinickia symbiotica]|uniref:Uncharacterized protein n=1 Tax=Trinickia symbiotica TaxID=863227 RepID=A0A2N7X277_9BURK|nr:hypothetical protein [Trinickia symbiotica]PMS35681.1 hypothetical protein C0Z20_17530 [Trinickia symbiotica]PPK47757.1 hypothetical protein B0G57_101727 [Trinickia symbiotica]